MKRVVLLGVVLAGLLAGTAQAQTTIIEPIGSHFPYQQWIDESKVPTPDVTLEVIEESAGGGCPFVASINACTILTEHRVWIGAAQLLGVHPREPFMHEVAHYFAEELPEWARERFDSIYAIEVPWLLAPGQMGGEEWFAEAYSECAVKPYVTLKEWTALGIGPVYGSRPIFGMRVAHNKVCRMIQNL